MLDSCYRLTTNNETLPGIFYFQDGLVCFQQFAATLIKYIKYVSTNRLNA
jgi:hypothetical protein